MATPQTSNPAKLDNIMPRASASSAIEAQVRVRVPSLRARPLIRA
jgi:hypothetical protein